MQSGLGHRQVGLGILQLAGPEGVGRNCLLLLHPGQLHIEDVDRVRHDAHAKGRAWAGIGQRHQMRTRSAGFQAGASRGERLPELSVT